MAQGPSAWASDVPVSMPHALTESDGVQVGDGYVFTGTALRHEITRQTIESMTPTFGPVDDPRYEAVITVPEPNPGGDPDGH